MDEIKITVSKAQLSMLGKVIYCFHEFDESVLPVVGKVSASD